MEFLKTDEFVNSTLGLSFRLAQFVGSMALNLRIILVLFIIKAAKDASINENEEEEDLMTINDYDNTSK